MMSQLKEKQTKPKKSISSSHTHTTYTHGVRYFREDYKRNSAIIATRGQTHSFDIDSSLSLGIEFKHFGHGNTAAAVQDPNLTTMLVGFPTYTTHSDQLS